MFETRVPWLCHAVSLFLFTCTPVSAQPPAAVSGCVEDSTHAVIPGATVILTSSDRPARFQAQTDEKGCFALAGVRSGEYQLRILAEAFSPYEKDLAVEGPVRLETVILEIQPIRDTVLVTATRTPASSDALGSSVDVIDRAQIRASGIRAASDLLRNIGSLTVLRTGNAGGITTLFLRGGESDYTKILIDGIPVNQPGGVYDFAHIPTDNIDRIEIVRGPRSAVFGSDAITGVVQLFTRPGTSSPEADYSIEGGSFGTFEQRAAIRGSWKKIDASNTFSRLDTDNIGRNNDYRNASYFANFGFTPDSRQMLRATLFHISTKAGAPGVNAPGFTSFGPDDHVHRLERAGGLTYRALVGSRLTQHLAYRLYDHDYTYFSAFGPSYVLHTRHRGEYHGDVAFHLAGTFSYGIDFDRENATVANKRHSRDDTGYYVQQQVELWKRLYITAGVRAEDNTTFGTSENPGLAVSFRFRPDTRLRFSAGKGIKEPNFTENFSENRFFFGNPDLLAERSRSWETAIEQSFWHDRIAADLTWFDNRFRNLIELVRQPDGSSRYQNIGRTLARGLELRARTRVRQVSIQSNYTYLDGHIQQSNQTSFPFRSRDPLLRRPRHSGDFAVTWSEPRWKAYWSSRFIGRRADSDFFAFPTPLTSNPGYTASDASFSYDFVRQISAFVRIENIFDRDYQEVLGYQALGRGVVVGTRVRLGGEK